MKNVIVGRKKVSLDDDWGKYEELEEKRRQIDKAIEEISIIRENLKKVCDATDFVKDLSFDTKSILKEIPGSGTDIDKLDDALGEARGVLRHYYGLWLNYDILANLEDGLMRLRDSIDKQINELELSEEG